VRGWVSRDETFLRLKIQFVCIIWSKKRQASAFRSLEKSIIRCCLEKKNEWYNKVNSSRGQVICNVNWYKNSMVSVCKG